MNQRKLTYFNIGLSILMIISIIFALWEGYQARQKQAALDVARLSYLQSLQTFEESQRLLEEKLSELEAQVRGLREQTNEN